MHTMMMFQIQLHADSNVQTLAELATSEPGSQEIQSTDAGHILITGDTEGNQIPVQVSGGQFVTIPVSGGNYQTVVASIQNSGDSGNTSSGQQQHMVVNAPIQIQGLQLMKTEPGEGGSSSLAGQHFNVLQMADGSHQIITIRQRSPDTRDSAESS